ncbi:MAG: hypothetical protein HPY53_15765 [Brevinematales bacterium]|nr:hypothetical protein [Brevinematales bacterium]
MRKIILFAVIVTGIVLLGCGGNNNTKPGAGKLGHQFSYTDPGAEEVFLAGEMNNWNPKSIPMKAGDAGVWTVTLFIDEGVCQYKFVVDGVWKSDPANPDRMDDGFGGFNSVLVLGTNDAGFIYRPGVPHGLLTNIGFQSKTFGKKVTFNLYLPAGYNNDAKYPVLFLLHGLGQNEHQWTKQGNIQNYMDNFLAKGAIKPFIIVMPSAGKSFYTNQHEKFIVTELYDFVSANYGVKPGKENTAVMGMSMGGFGAFYLAQRNPARFGYCISLSGYFDQKYYLDDYRDKPLKADFMLDIFCGSEDTLCYPTVQALKKVLDRDGNVYGYTISPGAHTWNYWRGLMPDALAKLSEFFYPSPVK